MAAQYAANPFTPSFGEVPLVLAGRDVILREMSSAFGKPNRSPELTTLIAGARGTGKTALLAKISEIAEESGWIAVKTMASPGMLEDIYQHAARDSRHLIGAPASDRRLTGIGVGQLLNLEWSIDEQDKAGWRIRLEALLDELEQHGSGLLIAVDEIDASVDEMIQLAGVYQLNVMDGRRVALVMAGLPHNVEKAKANKRISFVRRAQQRRLSRVDDRDVGSAMKSTVERGGRAIGDAALDVAVEAAGGFPFMIQLVGYRMWEESLDHLEITADDARKGAEKAKREMRSYILESTYRELSDGDVDFCRAMLEDEGASSLRDIAKRLGKPSGHVGTYRERLSKAGVIGEADRNSVEFELPGFKDFLRERLGL